MISGKYSDCQKEFEVLLLYVSSWPVEAPREEESTGGSRTLAPLRRKCEEKTDGAARGAAATPTSDGPPTAPSLESRGVGVRLALEDLLEGRWAEDPGRECDFFNFLPLL